jgi:hypothetical protein
VLGGRDLSQFGVQVRETEWRVKDDVLRLDMMRVAGAAAVRNRVDPFIAGVGPATRQSIRELVAQSQTMGLSHRQLARAIRDLVGLTPRQAARLVRFRIRLAEEGVSNDRIETRSERMAQSLRLARAHLIARTELMWAGNAGQQEVWREAVRRGFVNPQNAQRRWIVTPDDRLDEVICEPLEDKTVGIEEEFAPGVLHPPAHPACRCTTTLVPPKVPSSS